MTSHHLDRWRAEKTAAFLSAAVATAEPSPAGKKLFTGMAKAAQEQAAIIAGDRTPPDFHPSLRARLIARMVRLFGAAI